MTFAGIKKKKNYIVIEMKQKCKSSSTSCERSVVLMTRLYSLEFQRLFTFLCSIRSSFQKTATEKPKRMKLNFLSKYFYRNIKTKL